MKKLTLIGGAPLSGKTTLSKQTAAKEGGVELSTDSIRSWMLNLLEKPSNPDLFYSDGMSAQQFYETFDTPQSVVDGEIVQSKQVEKGIHALLTSHISWDHLILEGIALSPSFMNEIKKTYTDREVVCTVLADTDLNRITSRIRSRGLWGPLDSYPNELIPTEAQWVALYNQWFVKQATHHNINIIYN